VRTRVHVIRTRYPHWGAHSGIGQFLTRLDAARFHVREHIAADGDQDLPLPGAALRAWLRRRVQSKGMAWYKLSDVTAEANALWRWLINGSDVVHYLDGEHSAQYLPLLRRSLPRSRPHLIATFHQPPAVLETLVRADVIARLDRVTVVAQTQADFFAQLLPTARVHTILHGVDCDFFRPRTGPKPATDAFTCITVGHYLRAFETVRNVAQQLVSEPAIRFDVVSSRDTGVEGVANVRVHRGLSDDALRALYQRADALFLPLQDCTANNALLEGMACGLPVIATDLPAVRAYTPDEAGVFVGANDAGAFAAAISALRNAPEARQRMGNASRARALALDWAQIAPQYAQLYDDVCASRTG
jgi:glycosyltransferase involved in cell wall biosynthesis